MNQCPAELGFVEFGELLIELFGFVFEGEKGRGGLDGEGEQSGGGRGQGRDSGGIEEDADEMFQE